MGLSEAERACAKETVSKFDIRFRLFSIVMACQSLKRL